MTDRTIPFPENYGNFYSFGARRIAQYLAKQSLPAPKEDALHKELLDRFEEIDYLAAKRLLSREDSSDWHTVVAGEVLSELSSFPVQAASSLVEGLAAVTAICDRERIFPNAIDRLPDGIRLRIGNQTFAEIRRMPFESFQTKHCQRVQNALKGIRTRGEDERMVARLRSLPGFASADFRLDPTSHKEPQGFLLLPFPTNWATAMMSAMTSLGTPVKRHVAQELVAQLFGANSWHHLTAHADAARVWTTPYAVATSDTSTANWRYFRTAGEGIWAFGKTIESWKGKALVIDSCGSAMMSDGFYIATGLRESPNDREREGLPFCTPVDVIDPECSDEHYALARQVAMTLVEEAPPLEALGWSSDFNRNMFAANARLGSTGDKTLQIGSWWLRVFNAHQRAYLSVEQFDTDGFRRNANSIPLYKATLRYDDGSHVLAITEDYDRESVATIPNVSTEQMEQLRLMIVEPPDNPLAPAYWLSLIHI